MKRLRNAIISSVVLLCCINVLPLPADASLDTSGDSGSKQQLLTTTSAQSDFIFDTKSGTITGFKGLGGDVTIPSVINGVKVTSIGDAAFKNNITILSVKMPDGITSIGELAFSGCTGLKSIKMPDSISMIGTSAFLGCVGLTEITLPISIESVETSTFKGCTGLKTIVIPDKVSFVGPYAFNGCTDLQAIKLSASTEFIGNYAFGGCTGLTSISIPESVTEIEHNAFNGCKSLNSVIFTGDAPGEFGADVFKNTAADFIITVSSDKKGFDGDAWKNYKIETDKGNGNDHDGNGPKTLYGDVTGEGAVDSADYVCLRRYLLGMIKVMPAANWEKNADLNIDGMIDTADYDILCSYLINKINELPHVVK